MHYDFYALQIDISIRNNFLETDTCPFDQEFVYLCTKKFVRAVYQEILVFYYFKNSIKGTPKWRECIFSNEIPKSFQGPKVGPGPHTEKGSLHSHDAAAHHRQFRPVTIWAPHQILDPPLTVVTNGRRRRLFLFCMRKLNAIKSAINFNTWYDHLHFGHHSQCCPL